MGELTWHGWQKNVNEDTPSVGIITENHLQKNIINDDERKASQFPEIKEVLFYRLSPDGESLVFAPPDVAVRISAIHEAFSAETWGEFQSLIPEENYAELLKHYVGEEAYYKPFVIPNGREPFDVHSFCPEYIDGDYPDWLQQEQETWLPEPILRHWGKLEESVHNDEFWIINPKMERAIVERLRRYGISAQRRDDLGFY